MPMFGVFWTVNAHLHVFVLIQTRVYVFLN